MPPDVNDPVSKWSAVAQGSGALYNSQAGYRKKQQTVCTSLRDHQTVIKEDWCLLVFVETTSVTGCNTPVTTAGDALVEQCLEE
jgi:hypothetical protein